MDGTHIIEKRDALAKWRSPHEKLWDEIAELSMPRKVSGANEGVIPPLIESGQLHDATLRTATLQLANGFCSLVTPREEPWLGLEPPRAFDESDPVIKFYKECSEEVAYRLEQSNFYTEVQELYLDRAAMGTGCMFSEWDEEYDNLNFRHLPVGTYYIGQDHRGRADCIIACLSYTAEQAAQEFGLEELPPKLQDEVRNPKKNDQHTFLVAVEKTKPWADNKYQAFPYHLCAVHEESKKVVHQQGYYEMPAHVTRYLKWGSSPYGYAPTWVALPEAYKLGFLNKQMDVLAEKAANPPILAPASLEGEIGVGALDVTYVNDLDPNRSPREWATQGRYDIGKDRIEMKRAAIMEVMHGDLFRMFAEIDRTMTATEANLRQAEKVMQFSPTFSRLTSEFLDPLVRRVFAMLWRNGKLPSPPEELAIPGDEGNVTVPVPTIAYNNRISLAMRQLQNTQQAEFLAMNEMVIMQRPDVVDNLDLDAQFRQGWRNAGLPEDSLMNEVDVEETRMARAQQQQAAAQMAAAEQTAGIMKDTAAANGGELPPEMAEGGIM